MIKTETHNVRTNAGTRLMIGNLPYSVEKPEFIQAFADHADLQERFLSRPKKDDGKKNDGWGIITVDEPTASRLLGATILIRGRVARIKRARPSAM